MMVSCLSEGAGRFGLVRAGVGFFDAGLSEDGLGSGSLTVIGATATGFMSRTIGRSRLPSTLTTLGSKPGASNRRSRGAGPAGTAIGTAVGLPSGATVSPAGAPSSSTGQFTGATASLYAAAGLTQFGAARLYQGSALSDSSPVTQVNFTHRWCRARELCFFTSWRFWRHDFAASAWSVDQIAKRGIVFAKELTMVTTSISRRQIALIGVALGSVGVARPALATPQVKYSGGPVLEHVSVVQVNWGPNVTFGSQLPLFYAGAVNSVFIDTLTEYDTSSPAQTISRGTSAAVNLPGSPPTTDSAIQAGLVQAIGAGTLPPPSANTLYMLHFPPNTVITASGGAQSCRDFCEYHSTTLSKGQNVYYAVIPDQTSCTSCGNVSSAFDRTTLVASRALMNSVTDPAAGFNATPFAWIDLTNGEIADICAGQADSLTLNGTSYVVQKHWSNRQGTCLTTLPSSVPALSFWGASAEALLLALAGTVVINLRRPPGPALPAYSPNQREQGRA